MDAARSLKICGLIEVCGFFLSFPSRKSLTIIKNCIIYDMYTYLQIEDLEEIDTVIDSKDVTEDSIDPIPEINETDESELNTLSDKCEVENLKAEETTTDNTLSNKKKKKRREAIRREYSDDMLASAINDLRHGRTLIEAATKHGIPRSTLYMRAKGLGIQLNQSRNEYPAECMKAAINSVLG